MRRAGQSPHDIFCDEQGNVCLRSRSKLSGGGAAINVSALDVLRGLDAPGKFVRVINEDSGLDALIPLAWLDGFLPKSGKYGNYITVDQFDLETSSGSDADEFGEPGAIYN